MRRGPGMRAASARISSRRAGRSAAILAHALEPVMHQGALARPATERIASPGRARVDTEGVPASGYAVYRMTFPLPLLPDLDPRMDRVAGAGDRHRPSRGHVGGEQGIELPEQGIELPEQGIEFSEQGTCRWRAGDRVVRAGAGVVRAGAGVVRAGAGAAALPRARTLADTISGSTTKS
jgi:hypothetical protein